MNGNLSKKRNCTVSVQVKGVGDDDYMFNKNNVGDLVLHSVVHGP